MLICKQGVLPFACVYGMEEGLCSLIMMFLLCLSLILFEFVTLKNFNLVFEQTGRR